MFRTHLRQNLTCFQTLSRVVKLGAVRGHSLFIFASLEDNSTGVCSRAVDLIRRDQISLFLERLQRNLLLVIFKSPKYQFFGDRKSVV